MTTHPKEVIEFVLNAKERQRPSEEIVANIKDRLHYSLSVDEIDMIYELSLQLLNNVKWDIVKLNEAIEEKKKYEFENDHYIFHVKDKVKGVTKEFKIPLELADQIFNDFSKHGANMSGQDVMNKHSLTAEAWNVIKSRLWLYKASHILSPMSMENADKNGTLDEVIEKATIQNFEDRYQNKYKDSHHTTLEKKVKKLSKVVWELQWFMEFIEPYLNKIKPLNLWPITPLRKWKWPVPNYVFWDTHLWKINTDAIVKRLQYIADDIISDPSKEINISFMWDIYEALMQGGMHSWQVESMDWVYMGELFMFWVQTFIDMLSKILKSGKTIKFYWIGGNHDRVSMKNEHDRERMFATVFYEMLKLYFKNYKIEITNIVEKIWTFDVWNLHYIMNHWEEFGKVDAEKTAWKYWDTKMQNVILTAHLHSIKVLEGKNVTHIQVPAVAWQNIYDKDHWWFSHPWYAKVIENVFWLPELQVKRLP